MAETSEYVAEALSALKGRAASEGLMVDSSATYGIGAVLGPALDKAIESEGGEPFSARRHAEFNDAVFKLAEQATNAAQRDQAQFIGIEHIESAAVQLRAWKIWPFTGD
ncbi:MAG TPA: hypothetical protein VH331_01770 [Allosphingosinicella sp.]|nr:hypothetical protein [Allosphingosinicella sp.]